MRDFSFGYSLHQMLKSWASALCPPFYLNSLSRIRTETSESGMESRGINRSRWLYVMVWETLRHPGQTERPTPPPSLAAHLSGLFSGPMSVRPISSSLRRRYSS